MTWSDVLRSGPLPWLLEHDPINPGVRYFTLRDLLERDGDDSELRKAQAAVMSSGPVPIILAAQQAEGYWGEPKEIYANKYRGTDWQIIFLAQLGADGADPRIRKACEYGVD